MQNKPPLIAYIEDDGMLMNMYKNLFKGRGFEFTGARDFSKANELIKKSSPDIILLDLLLPNTKETIAAELNAKLGLKLLKKLKTNRETADIPVIILSNIDDPDIVEKTHELKADDYLVKANVLPKEVLAKVQEILKTRNIELPCDPIKEKCE